MRLFVSVDLPDSLTEPLREIQTALSEASGLRFTDPKQAHITMKFLGDVESNRISELESALEAAVQSAGVGSFPVTYGGVGAFPSTDYIRVVWVGVVSGSEQLVQLHETIDERFVSLGFDPESHEFTPHVTIARMEHAGGKEVVQEYLRTTEPEIGSMQVDDVRLTKSELTADGPEYSVVTAIRLQDQV